MYKLGLNKNIFYATAVQATKDKKKKIGCVLVVPKH